jgi:hypothetical protein
LKKYTGYKKLKSKYGVCFAEIEITWNFFLFKIKKTHIVYKESVSPYHHFLSNGDFFPLNLELFIKSKQMEIYFNE